LRSGTCSRFVTWSHFLYRKPVPHPDPGQAFSGNALVDCDHARPGPAIAAHHFAEFHHQAEIVAARIAGDDLELGSNRTAIRDDRPLGRSCPVERIQTPLLTGFRLSRADCEQQALRRCAIRIDSFLELSGRPHAPGGPGIRQHGAKFSLSLPLLKSIPYHPYPPGLDGEAYASRPSGAPRQFDLPD
jgi:hypothetical protein